jgi:REP element-mobilizing transposase RayT
MLHSYTKLYVHLIWGTKNRFNYFNKEIRDLVKDHILKYAKENNIEVLSINIQSDHLHLLISLRSDQKVDDIVKRLKGESSHWINSENIIKPKFSWQRGYGAFSISSSHLDAVKNYIKNQDEHHKKVSFIDEYKKILTKYGYSINNSNEL